MSKIITALISTPAISDVAVQLSDWTDRDQPMLECMHATCMQGGATCIAIIHVPHVQTAVHAVHAYYAHRIAHIFRTIYLLCSRPGIFFP